MDVSGPPILDFDANDRIAFEIWRKKWKSWVFLSNLGSKSAVYHNLVYSFYKYFKSFHPLPWKDSISRPAPVFAIWAIPNL
jgi:hypothetical protein